MLTLVFFISTIQFLRACTGRNGTDDLVPTTCNPDARAGRTGEGKVFLVLRDLVCCLNIHIELFVTACTGITVARHLRGGLLWLYRYYHDVRIPILQYQKMVPKRRGSSVRRATKLTC